ncbi:hypothetical protein TVAG_342800 [Trichomonas vaginalis G3]|uniref:Uncharacterized protein n=1 Tax=Trichomonas vaginalis (strain ATCC PRA-98 / G3) TaxID=412133 RepID=A2EJP2_TRIV3|nr:hypothetical protein TVAGG3_0579590 [Trichomonas vaginalis G3]EAY07116.1 hypothetical protein TVAG_342800 [Trichomonas vaginalis G3]KAI5522471.1 hypothetical protein TVAGG3_0579590 [Trichomonas vaginalis G3]|eukprot:XP_001319339.1 hypothetical protein [Trichomonas vaginalis G3]
MLAGLVYYENNLTNFEEYHQKVLKKCKIHIDNPRKYDDKIIELSEKLYSIYPDIIPTKLYSYYNQIQVKYQTFLSYTHFHYFGQIETENILNHLAYVSDKAYEYLEQISIINSWKYRICCFLLPHTNWNTWLHNLLEMMIDDIYGIIKSSAWNFVTEVQNLAKYLHTQSQNYCDLRKCQDGELLQITRELAEDFTLFRPLKLGNFFTTEKEWEKCLEFASYAEKLINEGKNRVPHYLYDLNNRSEEYNPIYDVVVFYFSKKVTTIEELNKVLKLN